MKKLVTLHMYAKVGEFDEEGATTVLDSDYRPYKSCMTGMVWLGSKEVELDFPEIDTRQAQIDNLEAQVQEERAQSQSRVNLLLERISKLQAIGHDD